MCVEERGAYFLIRRSAWGPSNVSLSSSSNLFKKSLIRPKRYGLDWTRLCSSFLLKTARREPEASVKSPFCSATPSLRVSVYSRPQARAREVGGTRFHRRLHRMFQLASRMERSPRLSCTFKRSDAISQRAYTLWQSLCQLIKPCERSSCHGFEVSRSAKLLMALDTSTLVKCKWRWKFGLKHVLSEQPVSLR